MTAYEPDRRTFLKASGATVAATLAAGCTSSGSGNGNGNGNGGNGNDGNGNGGNGNGGNGGGADFGGYLDDANGDTSLADHTGEDEVTVDVGVADQNWGYGPAAIRIDAGTTVVWEWTGDGGSHDVIENDGAFESEMMGDEGDTFEHTFEEAGTYTYHCTPHEASGMKGGVEVVE